VEKGRRGAIASRIGHGSSIKSFLEGRAESWLGGSYSTGEEIPPSKVRGQNEVVTRLKRLHNKLVPEVSHTYEGKKGYQKVLSNNEEKDH